MEALRQRFLLLPLLLSLLFPFASPPAARALDVWTGRWNGTLVVTTGPGTGRTLPCEFLVSQDGTGFAGTVSCPGFGPIPFSGSAAGGISGTVGADGSFTGSRTGRSASGTWNLPSRGNTGTWSMTRATP